MKEEPAYGKHLTIPAELVSLIESVTGDATREFDTAATECQALEEQYSCNKKSWDALQVYRWLQTLKQGEEYKPDESEICRACGAPNEDGQGYDSFCGECTDTLDSQHVFNSGLDLSAEDAREIIEGAS